MARKPDVPCAGQCGKLLWTGSTSLPPGGRTCRACRSQAPNKVCPQCGAGFKANAGDGRRTCSRACGQQYRHTMNPPAGPQPNRTCEVCGSRYRRTYGGQRTCGRTCGAVLRSRGLPLPAIRQPRVKTCAACAKQFTGSRWRFCSDECAKAAARARDLLRYGKSPEEVDRCGACGASVPPSRKRCDDCRAETLRAARRRRRRKDRARRRGVVHEQYTLAEIADRDRRMCGLCRKRVAMTKVVPNPKAPTIDHVLPLAAGGHDVRANVQLAHFECNWRKSAGGTQQLALVG